MAVTRTVTNPGIVPVDTQVYDREGGFKIINLVLAPAAFVNINGQYTSLMQRQIDDGTLVEGYNPFPADELADRPNDALPTPIMLALLRANAPTHSNPYATILDIGGGPAGSFASLSDVNFGLLADGDLVAYDLASGKWINVTSIAASKVTFNNAGTNVTAIDVQAAIAELALQYPQYASAVVAYVDPTHPKAADDANISTPFRTIMGAMPGFGMPPGTPPTPLLIHLAPGVYPENVIIKYSNINLMGAGFSTTKIQPGAGNALEYRPVDALTGPWDNRVHDLNVTGNVVVSGETAPASGIFYPSMCGNELLFVDCPIYGNMLFDHCNYLSAQGIFVNGDVTFDQCSGQWWNFSEVAGLVTLIWSPVDPNPLSDNSNYGWSPYDGTVSNMQLLVNGKVSAKQHTISGTLTLNTITNVVDLFGCFVQTIANPGGGTINNVGDFYDRTKVNLLTSNDVQGAIDELAPGVKFYSGVGNPNGVVAGQFPQHYLDTGTSTPYINTGLAPNNNLWAAI